MLDNIIESLRKLSLSPVIGVEIEFYITEPKLIPLMHATCQKNCTLFLKIEKEKGNNQYEIQLTHSADINLLIQEIYVVKNILAEIAHINSEKVDFSAKPFVDSPRKCLACTFTSTR